MKQALYQAEKAVKNSEVPVGAVLVKNGKIIARGFNSPIKAKDPTAHAEIVVLRKAAKKSGNYRLTDCELYVTLEPCLMCYSALVQARIKKLYYAAADCKAGIFSSGCFDLLEKSFNHRIEIFGGLLQDESSRILKDFFRVRRGAGAVERDGLENRCGR